ncbi:uncharacterized protein LOC129259183 [Lytechinus pictus]|uniref:uncharacterized protein LOC129259183 n=1 Tax=Lytechinus pictus TaxID=7653 RepID=UPI0030B9D0E2
MGGGTSKNKTQGDQSGLNLKKDERRFLQRCLYSLPFPPGTINAEMVAAAARMVERLEYHDPINILTKGGRAKGIYILVKGQVKVLSVSNEPVAILSPGNFFGEISTLFYVPVTATAQSSAQAQFLLLKEENLRKATGEVVSTDLMDYYVRQRYFDTSGKLDQAQLMNRICLTTLERIPLFGKWKGDSCSSLVKQCKDDIGIQYPVLLIPDMTMMVMEEDKSEEIVIVTRGKVEVRREKESITVIDVERWPFWIGEEGLFANIDNACSVRAVGPCQAIRIKKSTVQNITNKFKVEAGNDFEKRAKVWETRTNQHNRLSDRMKAEILLPVLINTLSRSEMFSRASLVFVYNLAMFFSAEAYDDKGVIINGSGNPAKMKKVLQAKKAEQINKQNQKNAIQGSSAYKSIQGTTASNFISENDVFLMPLKGEMFIPGVDNYTFEEKSIIYLPEAQLKEIKLTARGDTLVLTIEGSRLLSLCNSYPDIQVNIPRPVL